MKTVLILLILINTILSHPVHAITTTLSYEKSLSDDALKANEIELEQMLNWQQVLVIIEEETGKTETNPLQIKNYSNDIFNYLTKRIIILNGEDTAKAIQQPFPETEKDELLFGKGLVLRIRYQSKKPFTTIAYNNSIFCKDPNYKNKVYLTKGASIPEVEKVSTKGSDILIFTPGESVQEKVIEESSQKQTILEKLTTAVSDLQGKSLFFVMLLVFFLGMLHTLEAGHSKLIISSYMLNHKVSLKNGFTYATIFTLTHIADIILFGIILLAVNSFVDIYEKMSMLQTFSVYALIAIAVVLVFRNIAELLGKKVSHAHSHDHGHSHSHGHGHGHSHSHGHDHSTEAVEHTHTNNSPSHGELHFHKQSDHNHSDGHTHGHTHGHTQGCELLSEAEKAHAEAHGLAPDKSLKEQIILGFITGLAPCLMGWSIFMVVMATGSLWTLFPVVIAFGAGIFIALAMLVLVIGKSRHLVYEKFSLLQKYSPLLSSLLLLFFATLLVVK